MSEKMNIGPKKSAKQETKTVEDYYSRFNELFAILYKITERLKTEEDATDLFSLLKAGRRSFLEAFKSCSPTTFANIVDAVNNLKLDERQDTRAHETKRYMGALIAEIIPTLSESEYRFDNGRLYKALLDYERAFGEKFKDENWSQVVTDWAEAHAATLDNVSSGLQLGIMNEGDFYQAKFFAIAGKEETRSRTQDMLIDVFEDPAKQSLIGKHVDWTIEEFITKKFKVEHNPEAGNFNVTIEDETTEVLNKLFKRHNINLEDGLNAWIAAGGFADGEGKIRPDVSSWIARYIFSNFAVIRDIDSKKPESAKILWDKYGIKNFARYDHVMLERQVEEMDDKTSPYGVITFPYVDHNGAFAQSKTLLRSLADQLKNLGYLTRIVECGGKVGLAKRLVTLGRTYATKIEFLLLGGHGSDERYRDERYKGKKPDEIPTQKSNGSDSEQPWESAIQFGYGPAGFLTREDLQGIGVGRSSQFFSENAPLILSSCETGARAGFSTRLSEALGGRGVIAPDVATFIESIEVAKDDGKLRFRVRYRDAETMTVGR